MPDPCPHCGGSGLTLNTYTGEPDDCRKCDNGWVRARDKRGRFVREPQDYGQPDEAHEWRDFDPDC